MVAAPALTRLLLPPSPSAILVAAAWSGARLDGVDDDVLDAALELARHSGVAGRLARVYPERLAAEIARVTAANAATQCTLQAAARLLLAAGVSPVLVKFDQKADSEYSNVDVVVGDDGWAVAQRALSGWTVRTSRHPLEPDKLLLHPADGPAVHLHRHLSWFGVTVIRAETLRAAAVTGPAGLPVPARADALRSHVAHACFQNLRVDLDELLTLRPLLLPHLVAMAQAAAEDEGWGRSFGAAVAAIRDAIWRIDAGVPARPSLALPLRVAAGAGIEHAVAMARGGRLLPAARELAIRGPLLLAKRRRARRDAFAGDGTLLIGVSGPDGVGKTTVAGAIVRDVAGRHGAGVRIHPYGCIGCRTLGRGGSSPGGGGERRGRSAALMTALHTAHAGVDALEMALRMRLAAGRARRDARRQENATGRPAVAVVVTDRSPLDSLVKHAPRTAPAARSWFTRLARRYDRVVCLDAPAGTLAGRDADHAVDAVERRRALFADWSARLPGTVLLSIGDRRPDEIAAAIAASVLGWGDAAGD